MLAEPPGSRAASGPRLITVRGIAVGIALTVVWGQLLWRAWTDCQAGDSLTQTIKLVFLSPFVVSSVALAFGAPACIFRRRWPRAAAMLGLVLALIAAYLWFAWLLNNTVSEGFKLNRPGICPGTVPPWWPSWLPV